MVMSLSVATQIVQIGMKALLSISPPSSMGELYQSSQFAHELTQALTTWTS